MTNEEKAQLLDKIETAIYTGASSVTFKNRTINYRSLEHMYRIKSNLEQELGLKKPGRIRNNPYYDKGL